MCVGGIEFRPGTVSLRGRDDSLSCGGDCAIGEEAFESILVDFRPAAAGLAGRAQQRCVALVDSTRLGVDPPEAQALLVEVDGTDEVFAGRQG